MCVKVLCDGLLHVAGAVAEVFVVVKLHALQKNTLDYKETRLHKLMWVNRCLVCTLGKNGSVVMYELHTAAPRGRLDILPLPSESGSTSCSSSNRSPSGSS